MYPQMLPKASNVCAYFNVFQRYCLVHYGAKQYTRSGHVLVDSVKTGSSDVGRGKSGPQPFNACETRESFCANAVTPNIAYVPHEECCAAILGSVRAHASVARPYEYTCGRFGVGVRLQPVQRKIYCKSTLYYWLVPLSS
jgi:hypothetical protein